MPTRYLKVLGIVLLVAAGIRTFVAIERCQDNLNDSAEEIAKLAGSLVVESVVQDPRVEFASKPGSGHSLIVLKREQPLPERGH